MPWIYTEADLRAQRAVKDVFDPAGLMNPWKLFPTPISSAQVLAGALPPRRPAGEWI
jgi:FAD linked oxidases, C-terminal domain